MGDSAGTSSHANDVANRIRDGEGSTVHCYGNGDGGDGLQVAATAAAAAAEFDSKRRRLLGQLDEAKRLRDNIETRRTMLQERLARKCRTSNSNAKNSSGQQTATMATNNLQHSSMVAAYLSSSNGGALTGALLLSDDIDASTLIAHYLTAKEHLLVQAEVGKLLLAENRALDANAVPSLVSGSV